MKKEKVSSLFAVLCVIFVTTLLLSNLIAGKIFSVFGVTLPAAVILFPITYIFGDVFTEVYGFRKAKLVIWLGFACNLFAVLVYMITIALPAPVFWENQEAYRTVLGMTPRVLLASFTGYLFGGFSNSIILSKLKVRMKGKKLWVRTISSTIVGEALDTVIFISISFIGTMDFKVLLQMMLFQYLWKVLYEVVLTPLTYWTVGKLKKYEGEDVYDTEISHSPFAQRTLKDKQ